jgi:hypothetical protein
MEHGIVKRALVTCSALGLSFAAATGCVPIAALPSADEVGARSQGGALFGACVEAEAPRDRAWACMTLAGYFEEGVFGLPQDSQRAALLRATAIDTMEASCDLGNVADCTGAARVIGVALQSVGASDPEAAEHARWMERYAQDGCHGGDAAGCALLGRMYDVGIAVPRDPARSAAYYDLACSGGHRRSCLLLAERAEKKDALRAYERACDAGSGFGCAAAAKRHGDHVDQVVYFARGCALGDPAACVLGVEAHRKDGVLAGRGAVSFAWTGCEQGIPDACMLLGEAFQRGAGIPRSESAALDAYEKACDAGLPKACAAVQQARRGAAKKVSARARLDGP